MNPLVALRAGLPRASVLFALALALTGCVRFAVTESTIIRPTPEPADEKPVLAALDEIGHQGTVYSIAAGDGVKLHAVHVVRDPSYPTLIYFGGNITRASRNILALLRETEGLRANLLVSDFRGSGLSEGQPTFDRLFFDAINVYDFATGELQLKPDQIVVHGYSLGSFLAGYVALHRPVAGLVLEASATTTEDWVSVAIPWLFKPFVRVEIAENMQGRGNLWVVKRQPAPLLVVVGSKDRQTRPSLSEDLYAAARAAGRPAELLIVPGAVHGNALAQSEAQQSYRRWFEDLFSAQNSIGHSP